jgi:uncharacterized protein (DUF58 family)
MVESYPFVFSAFLFLLAILFHDPSILTVIYLLLGVLLFGRWWRDRGLAGLEIHRRLDRRAMLGETIRIRLEVVNRSWLPIPWVRIHESLPVELAVPNFHRQAFSLAPKGKTICEYTLQGHKRGYYRIGPLYVQSGDLFGMEEPRERQAPSDNLTVYPKIVPIRRLPLPSFSPMGALRFHQPLFEDPSRVIGKRDYQTGDSLRRIDWKSSAVTGKLQVRQFEPAISLEASIFLNLSGQDYEPRSRIDAAELAIVTAASLACYVAGKHQPVGLESNGMDPLEPESVRHSLPVRKGNAALMVLLEKLARLQLADGRSFADLLREREPALSWGTTLLVITGMPGAALFNELLRTRRLGLHSIVFLTAPVLRFESFEDRARSLGIPLYEIRSERDLERMFL